MSPYKAVVFFYRHPLSPTATTFGSGVSFAARTFLPSPPYNHPTRDGARGDQRQTGALLSRCKFTQYFRITILSRQKFIISLIILFSFHQIILIRITTVFIKRMWKVYDISQICFNCDFKSVKSGQNKQTIWQINKICAYFCSCKEKTNQETFNKLNKRLWKM